MRLSPDPAETVTYSEAMAARIHQLETELDRTRRTVRRRDRRIESLTRPRSLHCVSCTKRRT